MDFGTREHLAEKNGRLIIGGADVVELARKHGTPLYVTDERRIRSNYRRFAAAFPDADVYYAAKANGHIAVLRIPRKKVPVPTYSPMVSCMLPSLPGIRPDRILFNGNAKTDAELAMACETA